MQTPEGRKPGAPSLTHSSATFSECRRYRYSLVRRWDDSRPGVAFVGLNPSTADETTDDATIRKCTGFARRWDFGSLVMLNLFAWRSHEPRALASLAPHEAVGQRNDEVIAAVVGQSRISRVVLAWGAHPTIAPLIAPRAEAVRQLVASRARGAIGRLGPLCANGAVRHPLMLAYASAFVDGTDVKFVAVGSTPHAPLAQFEATTSRVPA